MKKVGTDCFDNLIPSHTIIKSILPYMHYTLQAFYDLSIGNQRWKIPEVLKEIGKTVVTSRGLIFAESLAGVDGALQIGSKVIHFSGKYNTIPW